MAVKVNKGHKVTKRVITEICKEARIMRRYRHPNVVKFYGVAAERVCFFIRNLDLCDGRILALKEPVMLVMELVDGGALDAYLQKKKEQITVIDRVHSSLSLFLCEIFRIFKL